MLFTVLLEHFRRRLVVLEVGGGDPAVFRVRIPSPLHQVLVHRLVPYLGRHPVVHDSFNFIETLCQRIGLLRCALRNTAPLLSGST